MVLSVRHRAAFYKRFELDIWGVLKTSALILPETSTFRQRSKFRKQNKNSQKLFSRSRGSRGLRQHQGLRGSQVWGKKSSPFSRRRRHFPWIKSKSKQKNVPLRGAQTQQGHWISWANRKGYRPGHRRPRPNAPYSFNPHFIPSRAKPKAKMALARLHTLRGDQLKELLVSFYYSKLLRIFDFFYFKHLKQQEYRWRARRRYIYRLDVIQRRVFKKKIKKRFVSLRLVKLFYLTFHYHQFRQLAQRTRRLQGCFEHNFFLALEGRLVSFMYRTSLLPNLFQCIKLVRSGGIIVDNCLQNHPNFSIGFNVLINFLPLTKKLIYLSLLYRLARKLILFNPPRYMFVSYVFLYCYMKRPPQRRDLVFPIALDMYRATGYAF